MSDFMPQFSLTNFSVVKFTLKEQICFPSFPSKEKKCGDKKSFEI